MRAETNRWVFLAAGTSLAADGEGKGRKSWNSGGGGSSGKNGGSKLACRCLPPLQPPSSTPPASTLPPGPLNSPLLSLNISRIFPSGPSRRVALEGHTDDVEDVAFHPLSAKGEELCSVGDDAALLFWDVRTGNKPVIKARGAAPERGAAAARDRESRTWCRVCCCYGLLSASWGAPRACVSCCRESVVLGAADVPRPFLLLRTGRRGASPRTRTRAR